VQPFDRFPLQTIQVHGHTTAYIRYGSGPPVVLLHGYAGAIWNWEHQIETLGRDFTLFVPDILGHGLSQKPRIPYNASLYLAWLEGFLDRVGIDRAHLVGNSMGCGLAIGLALARPARVKRLVLISGFPPQVLSKARARYLRMFSRMGSGLLFNLAYHLLGHRAFHKLLCGIVANPDLITVPVVARAVRLRKERGGAWPLWSSLVNVPDWEEEFAPKLTTLTLPTLIIWGQEDRFFPLELGRALHQLIPGSRFEVVPNAGHLPMWERPDIVNRLIREFLA
jgi:pimeloyl-ACP methyl ester carboxylesterase